MSGHLTFPILPAVKLFCIFIASSTSISWPSETWYSNKSIAVHVSTSYSGQGRQITSLLTISLSLHQILIYTLHHKHRRRLLEIAVGARFLLPFSSPSLPSLIPARPFFPSSVLFPQLSIPPVFPPSSFPSPCSSSSYYYYYYYYVV